jgi:hypothetical protein
VRGEGGTAVVEGRMRRPALGPGPRGCRGGGVGHSAASGAARRRGRARGSRRTGALTGGRKGRRAEERLRGARPRRCGRRRGRRCGPCGRWWTGGAAMASTVLPSIMQASVPGSRLDLAVERRGRLVEEEDRRVLEDHARKRDCAGAARPRASPPARPRGRRSPCGPSPSWRRRMNSWPPRAARRRPSGPPSVGPPVEEVLAHAPVEERRVLARPCRWRGAASPA